MEAERGRRNTLVLAGAFLLALGLYLPHPIYFSAGASMLVYLVGSSLYVHAAVARIEVERRCPPNAFEEEEATVEVRLTNFAWFPLYGVEVVDSFSPQSISRVRLVVPERLSPRAIYGLSYQGHCFKKRGRYQVGPFEVAVEDPLGVFRARRRIAAVDRIVVYPATVEIGRTPWSGSAAAIGSGIARRTSAGVSPVYRGAREYQTGDDPRFIHWALSARQGRLLVREFDREVRPQVTILLDLEKANLRGLGGCSTLEYQVKIAASLAARAVRGRVQVALLGETDETIDIRPGSTRRHLVRILETLVGVQMSGGVRLFHLLRTEVDRLPLESTVVLLMAGAPIDADPMVALVGSLVARRIAVVAYLLDRDSFPAVTEDQRDRGRRAETAGFAAALEGRGARVHVVSGKGELEGQLSSPGKAPAGPSPAGDRKATRARW